ncbi:MULTISPECIES: RAD55 family ATPase [Haloprofundus]|uniref:RAD55 family ATPase n=1 Tax=Haloprofundus TaxID=1911573 RepID=UPI000E43AA15|nr:MULTISPECIES: recombinase RecA [Haloprofundus]QCJ48175.1 recombinase RecA [Haloprofundus sp. MHR1]
MYDLSPALDGAVDPGTNLLVTGPPLTGKRALTLDILAAGADAGDGSIFVTTKDSAARVLDEFGDRAVYEDRPVAVVDCVTRQRGVGDVRDDGRVKYTSSPVDMTGIGIKLSEFLQTFYADQHVERNRIGVHSLSTLLMYSNLQTVFRFLHVFTGRIQSVDGLGLFCIDSTVHDDRTLNTLKQLFDGIVVTSEDAPPTLRL